MNYGFKKEVSLDYEKAIEKVTEALAEQGFGILTQIDVRATLKKKLDVDVDNYIILGACNPPFAHRALQAEPDIGLLLPCNVVVSEKDSKVSVSVIKPTVAMSMVDNPALEDLAKDVESRLQKVMDALN